MPQLNYALFVSVIIYQIFVSIRIYHAEEYERAQRLIQITLIWCIPIVAAFVLHSFLRNQRKISQVKINNVIAQDQNVVLGYEDIKN